MKLINIEMKTDIQEYDSIEKDIITLIKKYPKYDQKILLSSFNFNSLIKARELDSKVLLGFLWGREKDFKKISNDLIQKTCNFLNPSIKLYSKYKSKYDKLNMKYNLWTIKDSKQYHKFLNETNINSLICNGKY